MTLRQKAFKADEITYLDRKTISLDRMLLNLFELLRFDGRPAVRKRQRAIDVQTLVSLISSAPERFSGFGARPDVTSAWLVSDLLDLMNRGKPGREVVVGPRPLHLNAFKLANPKAVADYGASAQVWAMIYHADRPLLARLMDFFGRGLDRALDRYDGITPLDLETLAILGMVDKVQVSHSTTPPSEPIRPLCPAQGYLLTDDLRRLLTYEDVVPRHVLAGYVRTAIGLHLSLYIFRLFRLLPDLVRATKEDVRLASCVTAKAGLEHLGECSFREEIVVDLTGDPRSGPAGLARGSAARQLAHIPRYVQAVITINRLKDFAGVHSAGGKIAAARTVPALLHLLRQPPTELDGFFTARIADIVANGPGETEDPITESILALNKSALDKYVELVCLQRLREESNHLIKMVDSLCQKNRSGGYLRQTASARSPRWFALDSHLLETLIQLAVVDRSSSGEIRTKTILIEDFVEWVRRRYGFVIYAPAHRVVPAQEHEAWRTNELALRERLHETGFYTDLSDAFNAQTIRPRYRVET